MKHLVHRAVVPAALAAMATLAVVACAHEHTPPPSDVPVQPAPPVGITHTTSQVVSTAPKTGVNVSPAILEACEIPFGDVDDAPKFDFDESALRPGERELLRKVAACVTTGPLKGRSLTLVGRADPRGETEYNFALGESRAGSVGSYLTELGVDTSKLMTTSRGELDATGTDEDSWQRDRRVDVDLR